MLKKLIDLTKKIKWPKSKVVDHVTEMVAIDEEPGPIHHEEPIPVPTDPTIVDK